MLLYDEGAMFKAHQDSEKAPRMFGTLVIALPSKHEGGEVRVNHAGETRILETSPSSAFESSYLAWFSDVTHEVKPVLSGRRLVLTYNLIHTTMGSRELGATVNVGMSKLRRLLSYWKDNVEVALSLAFLFDHEYTDESLNYDNLKGHDLEVSAYLRAVCEEFGLCFYLANLEREIIGSLEDEDAYGSTERDLIDAIEASVTLTKIIELDGFEVASDIVFDGDLFIQNDIFEDMYPDDEECSGYTGNEGITTTLFYKKTAAILMPRERRMEFLLRGAIDKGEDSKIINALDQILDHLRNDSSSTCDREDFDQICSMATQRSAASRERPIKNQELLPLSDKVVLKIIDMTVEFGMKASFLDTFQSHIGRLVPGMYRSVGVGLLRFELSSALQDMTPQFLRITTFSTLYEIIEEIKVGLEIGSNKYSRDQTIYLAWLSCIEEQSLKAVTLVSSEDAESLLSLCKNLPSQELFNRVLPAAKRNAAYSLFCVTFLAGIFTLGEGIPENIMQTIFKDVLGDLVDTFSVETLTHDSTTAFKKTSTSFGPRTAPLCYPPPDAISQQIVNNLATLLCGCHELDQKVQLNQLIKKINASVIKDTVHLFSVLFIPLLKSLAKIILQKPHMLQASSFQELYQRVLSAYVNTFVRREPTPPSHWSLPAVHCSCEHCRSLNIFLASVSDQVWRLKDIARHRNHVESKLCGLDVTSTTDRSTGQRQTLVVTKTQAGYQRAHKEWQQRYHVVKNDLRAIGHSTLKILLADRYQPIMDLEVDKTHTIANPHVHNSVLAQTDYASNRVLSPISRKVPRQVIILDDD